MNLEHNFGLFIKTLRLNRDLTMRELAITLGISAAYLSKLERNELPPPSEKLIRIIAALFDLDADELLAIGGKISSDLLPIIFQHPSEISSFLRDRKDFSKEDWLKLKEEEEL